MSADQYDKSNYPGCWDEDEEGSPPKSFEDDMLCAVCAQVLVDPLTLRCGHSFCQICLARVWHSRARPQPANIQCPSCRQPWGHLPRINIQLRNIVEGSHRDLVSERRDDIMDNDRLILEDFSRTKANTLQHTLLRQQPQDVRRVVTCLTVLFVSLVIIMVVMTVLAVWVFSGAGGEFMRKPVRQWTNADVISWVDGLGEWTSPGITELFRVEALTGPQLLLVDDQALFAFGVESEFRRQTILQAVVELKTLDYSTPKNFQQFKAAHRRTTLLLAMFYSMWPRLTFLYASLFEYYPVVLPVAKTQFTTLEEAGLSWKQVVVFAVEIVLFPHVAVCVVALHWLPAHPLVGIPLLVHCGIAMIQEILTAYKALSMIPYVQPLAHARSLLRSGFSQLVTFVLSVTVFLCLWPLVPHFICDLVFYLTLWNNLLVKLFLLPLNYLLKRRNNRRIAP